MTFILLVILMMAAEIQGAQTNVRQMIRLRQPWNSRPNSRPSLFHRLPLRLRHLAQPFHQPTNTISLNTPDSVPSWVPSTYTNRRQKSYGMCNRDRSLDQLLPEIKRLFPGQFMTRTEVKNHDVTRKERLKRMRRQRKRDWVFEPTVRMHDTSELIETTGPEVSSNTRNIAQGQTVNRNFIRCEPTCCDTEKFHVVYENVTIDNINYPMVNLQREKQFISVGFCPETDNCPRGRCYQHYSKQYVVIWNMTVDHWPPVDLTPYDFPSHCSWIDN